MPTRVTMFHKITINAPQAVVYSFVIDPSKDPLWRTEVDKMEVQGPIQEGTTTIEYATLFGGLMKTVTPALIKTLKPNSLAVFVTPEGHPTWLESHRELRDLGDGRTEFAYRLSFDVAQGGVIGAIYAKLLKTLYEPRVPKYQRKLKELIEASVQNQRDPANGPRH